MAGASSCMGAALGRGMVFQEPAGAKDIMEGCIWGVTGVTIVAWDSYSQGALLALKHRHKTKAHHRIFGHQDWGCSSRVRCSGRGRAAPDPSPVLMSNRKFCILLNWVCWSTLKPHLKYFILPQQGPGLLGSDVIGVLDVLNQLAVGLCQAGTALLQLLNSIFLQTGQILHEYVD